MRILYITNGLNGPGGLERVLSIKASMLAESFGHEVAILTLNNTHINPFYTFSSRIQMFSIPVSGGAIRYFVMYKRGIQSVVDQVKPDIICVCDDGLKGFFIPKIIRTDAKIIYERHASKLIEVSSHRRHFFKRLKVKFKWALMEYFARSFDSFVVLTSGNLKEWPDLSNILVIPNPLSFYPAEASSLLNKRVICVGKICFQKGQDLLVKAWQIVHAHYPDWELALYGKIDDAELLGNIALDQYGIKHNMPVRNIQEKYIESSIYAMSSRSEGFGMVLIEAMSCGLPCVSFDCHWGPRDVITNQVDGLIVENGNIEALARGICELIENTEMRIRMGTNARENAKAYLPAKIVAQWDKLFRELMGVS